MTARPLMIQGTASTCGKSLMCAAFCRIFRRQGYRVAPFKAQNMSNNSFVTRAGLEMGRAQVVQAAAAEVEPDVRMNPVLIKPSSDTGAQVVLGGKPAFTMDAVHWHDTREQLRGVIREAWNSLSGDYEIIVLEGAGSPAEINLKKNDVVNMGMAAMADAPVLIVGDIDRGGVFASLAGTMQLLDENERERVKGFIINKFRGDAGLLEPGLRQIEELTGIPVLGVVPWIDHTIDDEDGVSGRFATVHPAADAIDICTIRLPHISNFTDFIPLETIPGVSMRWCDRIETFGTPDLLIIPGTKATITDLHQLKKSGIADAVKKYADAGGTILGICGGFQMLGTAITDAANTESATCSETGLGLLDMVTRFQSGKTTVQTTAVLNGDASWLFAGADGVEAAGYEIHHGRSTFGPSLVPFTQSTADDGSVRITGVASPAGTILGTYLHGLFDRRTVTAALVDAIRQRKGLVKTGAVGPDRIEALNRELDRLAEAVRNAVDMEAIRRITGVPAR